MTIRLGIDLGTTFSAVSYFDVDKVETLELEAANGGKLLPSVVYYEGADAAPIVGTTAVNALKSSPELVVRGIKKEMGTDYTTPPLHGRRRTPAEVSAEILKTLMVSASELLGEAIADVVVTVPAYFGDHEREQTRQACALAGVPLRDLLSEPLAAAIAYAVNSTGEAKAPYVLVFDLGGGTFDVTLMRSVETLGDGQVGVDIDVIAKDGSRVGGLDWDQKLFDWVCDKCPTDIRADPRLAAEVLLKCEAAKIDLSRATSVTVTGASVAETVPITREEFEGATQALLLQTQLLLEGLLAQVEHGKEPIRRADISVVLVGGSSRMPAVSRMIESVMGRAPLRHKNPDLLVTVGAAYYAQLLAEGKLKVRPVGASGGLTVIGTITDIGAEVVGVEIVRNGKPFNAQIIPQDAKFGAEYRGVFATAEDNMTTIDIVLYSGPEVSDPAASAECERLTSCAISGLPPGRPRGAKVEVVLGWDGSGILRGRAIDCQTQRAVAIEFNRGFGAARG